MPMLDNLEIYEVGSNEPRLTQASMERTRLTDKTYIMSSE